ncbi:hypothetical protein DD592_26780, partial [Enterobacter cloacae complex sp. 2DZ2F20B]
TTSAPDKLLELINLHLFQKKLLNFSNYQIHSYTYTGHSLRRSSTTLLANTGANMTEIKQHGGWKSSSVAEQYIEDSITNKINRGKKCLIHYRLAKKISEVYHLLRVRCHLRRQK